MNLIFVAGLPRSGTTMVQNILDSHPRIYGGPEFDRIPNIIDLRRKLIASVNMGRIDSYTSKSKVDEGISSLIKSLITNVKTTKDLKYVSEKTPWNILVFEDLMELFPEAKFIHVLRNPIDVFASMKNVFLRAKKNGTDAPDFTRDVNIAISYMVSVYQLMNKLEGERRSNLITVKYEDFIHDVEGESKKICDFIELPWDQSLLNFNNLEHPGEKNMIGNGVWYSSEMYKQDPKARKEKKGHSDLTTLEIFFLETVLSGNSYLSKHGYSTKKPMAKWKKALGSFLIKRNVRRNYYSTKSIRTLN